MKARTTRIWPVVVFALTVGCQSKPPPPTIVLHLDPPGSEDAVQFSSLDILSEINWTSANHFGVKLHLPDRHIPAGTQGTMFTIEEVRFVVNGGGSWFRDRFGMKLTVKGHWQGEKDDDGVFSADEFVAYPHGIEFRANDSNATAWLEGEVRGLWHELLRQIRNGR